MSTEHHPRIRLVRAEPNDAGQLTVVQARTFFDDRKWMPEACLARTPNPPGPPGCTSVTWNHEVIEHPSATVYKAMDGDRIVGGLILVDLENGSWDRGRIYVDPDRQNEGNGQAMIRQMFALHPNVKRWQLGTPDWAGRNKHFYERMGFVLRDTTAIDRSLRW